MKHQHQLTGINPSVHRWLVQWLALLGLGSGRRQPTKVKILWCWRETWLEVIGRMHGGFAGSLPTLATVRPSTKLDLNKRRS